MISTILTFYIFIVMSLIAKIHMYWLKGGLWPGKDKQDLIDKVIGRGDKLPSELAFIFVILCFAFFAVFPVLVHYKVEMGISGYEKYIFLIIAIIFILRAMSMYIPQVASRATKIFLEYNNKYYVPLIASLAFAYFGLYYFY